MHVGGSQEKIRQLPRYQKFLAVIVHSEVQPVGSKGDQDLELTFEVIRGPSKGRRIRQRITLWSHDMNRCTNGRAKLGILCRALGGVDPSDSAELHGMPLILRLTRKRGSEDRPTAGYVACSEADRLAWEKVSTQAERDDRNETVAQATGRSEHEYGDKGAGKT
jgi:hypothetical protein